MSGEWIHDLHARNVSEVNARTVAEGRCIMHNSDVNIPAVYVMALPIGNEITLCAECCAWWRKDAAETADPMSQPVWITDLTAAETPGGAQ